MGRGGGVDAEPGERGGEGAMGTVRGRRDVGMGRVMFVCGYAGCVGGAEGEVSLRGRRRGWEGVGKGRGEGRGGLCRGVG